MHYVELSREGPGTGDGPRTMGDAHPTLVAADEIVPRHDGGKRLEAGSFAGVGEAEAPVRPAPLGFELGPLVVR